MPVMTQKEENKNGLPKVPARARIYYYPGCSLMSSARELGDSLFQMARIHGAWLSQLQDWNCCGASPAHSVNQDYALMLAGRNLLLAERQGIDELHVICPSCFVRLRTAAKTFENEADKNEMIESVLGKKYQGTVKLKFFLEMLANEQLEMFKKAVINPLKGLKGVLYFGCLLTRPEWLTGFDVRPYEENLNDLVRALGIETVNWGYAKQWCGSHLAVTKPETVDDMVDRIRDQARRVGANCIIAFCPLCQVNLELRGKNVEPLPVFYASELIGMAANLPGHRDWLNKHLIDPIPLLTYLKLI